MKRNAFLSFFSAAQVLVDEDRSRRFVFTESCNFSLLKSVTQSLAGRTGALTLAPFSRTMKFGFMPVFLSGFLPGGVF